MDLDDFQPNPNGPPTDLQRAMDDLWRRTLAQIPTLFGKIVYLAELRDENSGTYQHFGLAQRYSAEEADRILRESHERVFGEWLNCPLEHQRDNLEEYLRTLDDDRETVLRTWMTLAPYNNLIPINTREAERLLYISDLELILDVLRNELSA